MVLDGRAEENIVEVISQVRYLQARRDSFLDG